MQLHSLIDPSATPSKEDLTTFPITVVGDADRKDAIVDMFTVEMPEVEVSTESADQPHIQMQQSIVRPESTASHLVSAWLVEGTEVPKNITPAAEERPSPGNNTDVVLNKEGTLIAAAVSGELKPILAKSKTPDGIETTKTNEIQTARADAAKTPLVAGSVSPSEADRSQSLPRNIAETPVDRTTTLLHASPIASSQPFVVATPLEVASNMPATNTEMVGRTDGRNALQIFQDQASMPQQDDTAKTQRSAMYETTSGERTAAPLDSLRQPEPLVQKPMLKQAKVVVETTTPDTGSKTPEEPKASLSQTQNALTRPQPAQMAHGPAEDISAVSDADFEAKMLSERTVGLEVAQAGEMRRAEASASSPLQMRPEAQRAVVAQLAQVNLKPDQPVELRLDPQELGQVRMVLSSHDQSLTLVMSAERPETLDLMRRHIDQLAQEFHEMGYTDLNFSFADQQASSDQHEDGTKQHMQSAEYAEDDIKPQVLRLESTAGLDIRI